MAVIFNQRVKHGKLDLHPGIVYSFADQTSEDYFVAAGWASLSEETAAVEIAADEAPVDPDTIFASGPSRGQRVL